MAKADFDKAKDQYPSTKMSEADWVGVFDRRPDVMWAIVADIYNVVRDEEERDAGIKRMGRRPARSASSMDEVWRTILPQQYTLEPFAEAFPKLMKGKSQRQFASRMFCNQATVSRLLSGELTPDMAMLEAVARAAKVPPGYFLEWRAGWVSKLVQNVLTERPHMSITAVKKIRATRRDDEIYQTIRSPSND